MAVEAGHRLPVIPRKCRYRHRQFVAMPGERVIRKTSHMPVQSLLMFCRTAGDADLPLRRRPPRYSRLKFTVLPVILAPPTHISSAPPGRPTTGSSTPKPAALAIDVVVETGRPQHWCAARWSPNASENKTATYRSLQAGLRQRTRNSSAGRESIQAPLAPLHHHWIGTTRQLTTESGQIQRQPVTSGDATTPPTLRPLTSSDSGLPSMKYSDQVASG